MDAFWNDQRIVVTGGAGFVGAALVRMLVESGASVVVLDDFSRGKTKVPGAKYVRGDATSLTNCLEVLDGADGLFNLAARVAGVTYNQTHHAEMFSSNLLLQTAPLMAAVQHKVEAVQVSSACVYAPEHNHPAVEMYGLLGRPTSANLGYALAKRAGERVAQNISIPCSIVRPSNVYGVGDHYDEETSHVIAALIRKIVGGDGPIVIFGDGSEIREFIYVDDVAAGMLAAFRHGKQGSAYNLGTGGETKVDILSIALLIRGIACQEHRPLVFDTSRGGGDKERWSSGVLAEKELHWKHTVGLHEGLSYAIDDYKERMP